MPRRFRIMIATGSCLLLVGILALLELYSDGSRSSLRFAAWACLIACIHLVVLIVPVPKRGNLKYCLRLTLLICLTVVCLQSLVLGFVSLRTYVRVVDSNSPPSSHFGSHSISFSKGNVRYGYYFWGSNDYAEKHCHFYKLGPYEIRLFHIVTLAATPPRPNVDEILTVSLQCPFWNLTILTAVVPVLLLIRGPLRRWRRQSRGLCTQCGYDLTGLPEPRCPECGKQSMT